MDSTLFTVLINAGTAGAVLAAMLIKLMVPGWVYKDVVERLALKEEECTAERERADTAVAAAAGARDVMAAIQLGLQMSHDAQGAAHEAASGGPSP